MNRRQALAALAVSASGVLAACAGKSIKQPDSAPDKPAAPVIKFSPANAATDVAPTAPVGIQVEKGRLQRVTLTNPQGVVVTGVVNRDRTSYTTTEPLGYGVAYTWGGSVVGQD